LFRQGLKGEYGEAMNGHSILLVEDDPNDILFVQRAFKQANIKTSIHIVNDGDTAVSYLSGTGDYNNRDLYPLPTLILLDLKLPRRSGIEILEWIRQQPDIRRIPVVVLTSSRESIDLERSYDLGVNSYLVKPVKFEALSNMIEAIDTYWLQLNEYPPIQSG
jgi:CheY-like chemotaxis protein